VFEIDATKRNYDNDTECIYMFSPFLYKLGNNFILKMYSNSSYIWILPF